MPFKDPNRRREYQKLRLRKKRATLEVCDECGAPSHDGSSKCVIHLSKEEMLLDKIARGILGKYDSS